MRPFRDLSIRHKLTLIVLLTSAVAIVLGGVISVVYERLRSQRELVANLSAEAEIIGANSAAALAFRDQKAAQEILSALRFRREIIYACLYDSDGNVFAEYRTAATGPGRAAARAATHENYWLDDGDLLLCRPLRLGEDEVGSICLRADLRAVRALVAAYAGISLAVVCVLLALSWLISIRLRRIISDPILELANLTRRVGANRDYSLRAAKRNEDEIGVLTDGLNRMLDQIQEDETELRRAYQRLQASEERFRQLAENINEVFWLTDTLRAEIIYVSPAYERIWGRDCASLYKSPGSWIDAIHPEDRGRVSEAVETKPAVGEYDEEYRIVRPDGSLRWVRDRAFPIRNEAGAVYRLAGIAEDITERKRLEQELLDISEREQCRIGQDLHDGLGQHLFATIVPVAMLENELREQGRLSQAQTLVEIRESVQEALAQTRHLARGLYPVGLKTEGLGFALRNLAGNISRSSHVDCRVDCPQEVHLPDMTVATHLYRIAQEAINNALKHGHATQVSIGWRAAAEGCTLTVADNGSGIAPARRPAGGMGLQIMRSRARMIGGRLEIRPREGGGTIVRCTLQGSAIV